VVNLLDHSFNVESLVTMRDLGIRYAVVEALVLEIKVTRSGTLSSQNPTPELADLKGELKPASRATTALEFIISAAK
jgi:hypothetical protein